MLITIFNKSLSFYVNGSAGLSLLFVLTCIGCGSATHPLFTENEVELLRQCRADVVIHTQNLDHRSAVIVDELHVNASYVGNTQITQICRILQRTGAEIVDISQCSVDDECMAGLHNIPRLNSLDISGTQITPIAISKCLHSAPRITAIRACSMVTDSTSFRLLAQAKPNIAFTLDVMHGDWRRQSYSVETTLKLIDPDSGYDVIHFHDYAHNTR